LKKADFQCNFPRNFFDANLGKFWIFAEFRWGKIITWIVGISAVIMPILLIDNYRIFVIAVLATIAFEIKNLLQK
jgi:hypothetical protein